MNPIKNPLNFLKITTNNINEQEILKIWNFISTKSNFQYQFPSTLEAPTTHFIH